jgi:hypothetical protein
MVEEAYRLINKPKDGGPFGSFQRSDVR